MSSDNQNGHNEEDAEFQRHIQQMLSNGPEANTATTTNTSWQSRDVTTTTAAVSEVDLDSTAASQHDVDESPFRSPDIGSAGVSMSHAYPAASQYTTTTTTQAGGNASKLDVVKAQVKEFSIDTFRTTKQLFSEMMGKGTRTVDPKVDVAISELRVLQATYMRLLDEATNMQSYFSNVIYSQKQMTNTLGELALRDPKLASDFNVNAETQRILIKNGEQLLGAISFFVSNMRTLCTRTIQDCLDTAKKYESARLQYDTYRSEHEQVIHSGGAGSQKSVEIRKKFEEKKQRYEQLKQDMIIKMQFLEENKSKVVHRQMLLFHNAVAAYFSGNQEQLDKVLSQFSINLRRPNSEAPSWLEK